MTQNVYDDEKFFEAYGRLPRSIQGLDGAPEWPALRALLPPLDGRRVLDLGCGFGWFCRWAREHGAAHVLGVDVSERIRALVQDPETVSRNARRVWNLFMLDVWLQVHRRGAAPSETLSELLGACV